MLYDNEAHFIKFFGKSFGCGSEIIFEEDIKFFFFLILSFLVKTKCPNIEVTCTKDYLDPYNFHQSLIFYS